MTREYDEKRDFIRIDIDCKITFKLLDEAAETQVGHVSNLSGRGMMFISDSELEKGSTLEIDISPKNILTPSLHANVNVVRVIKQRHSDGYEIGAVIKEIYEDDK
ncbi:MAG: PilZ domain-containing protein [Woeseiaceae bacterium]